jgi:tRNA pseudouridine38-40 synthase
MTFKLTLAYDGTNYVGWQRQAAGTSIQGLIEDALRDLDRRDVVLHGAGRTDAGVHALGQAASCTLDRALAPDVLVRALNARLPADVRVVSAASVAPDFHARFAATAKTYRYRIYNAEIMTPFERKYAWHVFGPLNVAAMDAAARLLEGRHDFAAFQTASGTARTTERTVTRSRVTRMKLSTTEEKPGGTLSVPRVLRGGEFLAGGDFLPGRDLIVYEISGDGFLRHMVRAIAGTLVDIGRGRRASEEMRDVLASSDRRRAGPTAPARGLFLVGVEYDGDL